MMRTPLATIALLLLTASAASASGAEQWLSEQGYVPPDGTEIIACHGYGCARRTAVSVDGAWLGRAGAILKAGQATPQAERQAIGAVIKLYTAYLAASFGTRPDAPRSPPSMSGVAGQMDCLDETANTTSLLLVLEENGLLVHHEVRRPESRGFFFDGRYPHFSAVVTDRSTGRDWVVDPWKRRPGQYPEILPLEQWRQDS